MNIFKLLREVEEEADRLVQEANRQAERIHAETRRKAEMILSERETAAREASERLAKESADALASTAAQGRSDLEKRLAALRQRAQGRMDQAADLILSRLRGNR